MEEATRKGRRKRNHISNRQRCESAKAFAETVRTGGLKADLKRIVVIEQEKA